MFWQTRVFVLASKQQMARIVFEPILSVVKWCNCNMNSNSMSSTGSGATQTVLKHKHTYTSKCVNEKGYPYSEYWTEWEQNKPVNDRVKFLFPAITLCKHSTWTAFRYQNNIKMRQTVSVCEVKREKWNTSEGNRNQCIGWTLNLNMLPG